MKRYRNVYVTSTILLVLLLFLSEAIRSVAAQEPENSPISLGTTMSANTPDGGFGHFPLSFVPNRGQVRDDSVKFQINNRGKSAFFRTGEFQLVMGDRPERRRRALLRQTIVPLELRVVYQNANAQAVVRGAEPLPGVSHFLHGNDRSQWETNVESYRQIVYEDLFPGINLEITGTEGQIKSSFVVVPQADPMAIQWSYLGADAVTLDAEGDLVITISRLLVSRTLRETAPVAWQVVGGKARPVPVTYSVESGNIISFNFPQGYDPNLELVIDPVLEWGTYLGNGGTDEGADIAYDSLGNILITGYSYCTNYPLVNEIQGQTGEEEVIISKLNPTGTELLYSTCLGGLYEDRASSIAVDAADNIIVGGYTYSADFPRVSSIASYSSWSDWFITKLNSSGSDILYSTLMGGGNEDELKQLAVSTSGQIYAIGTTKSSAFQKTNNAYDKTYGSGGDMAVVRIDPALSGTASLLYSSFLGGSSAEEGWGIALDSTTKVYLTGKTASSSGVPLVNAIQATKAGASDVWIGKMDLTQSGSASMVFGTYLGGSAEDVGRAVATGAGGLAYVTGYTESSNFPNVSAFQTTYGGNRDAFVAKIDTTAYQTVYSSYLGGSQAEEGSDLVLDSNGLAQVVGYTASSNFPQAEPIQARGGDACITTPCTDAFLSAVAANGATLPFSTYLGGISDDFANGIVLDSAGNRFVVGTSWSANFPVGVGSYDTSQTEPNLEPDCFVVKISAGTQIEPTITPINTPTAPAWPTTPVLDDFNRADGALGNSWADLDDNFTVSGQRMQLGWWGEYWTSTPFGTDQEVYATLSQIDSTASEIGLVLKAQVANASEAPMIEVLYAPGNHLVQVWTNDETADWVKMGEDIPITFVNGDRFGARVSSSGEVEIFRNQQLIGIRSVADWPYVTYGGYIGLFSYYVGTSYIDNFGGGDINLGTTLTPSATPTFTQTSMLNTESPTATNTITPTETVTHTPTPTQPITITLTSTSTVTDTPTPTDTLTPTISASPSPTPEWILEGEQPSAFFGWSVSTAGDINGDTFTDVIIGAPHYSNGAIDEGAVFIYYGTSNGLDSTPKVIEGDEPGALFGWSVSSAGNVNGDAYDDVIVGAIGCSNPEKGEGCAYVYLGAEGRNLTPGWMAEGNKSHAAFGYVVGTAGDVNGDERSDIFVGAPNYTHELVHEGKAFVYLGAATETGVMQNPYWEAEGNQEDALFGLAISGSGDVNGDNQDDLIVGAPNASNDNYAGAGKAYVFLSNEGGLGNTAATIFEGNEEQAHFGEAVAAGDVNGDNLIDMIIGAPDYGQTDSGAVFLFLNTVNGLDTQWAWSGASDQANANYGISIAFMNALEANGVDKLIIGANRFDGEALNSGRVYVYTIVAGEIDTDLTLIIDGTQAYENFGYSVGTAGSGKFFITAPQWDDGLNDADQVDKGQVLIW